MATTAHAFSDDARFLTAFRITSGAGTTGPTRTAEHPISIALPAQLQGIASDRFDPDMIHVKYQGEWYLLRRELMDVHAILHPRVH
ncbi:MAG TPA: hypothetical protein VHB50_02280 [Bryobacteraceae bacterium]|nr:hypothetical protein [Bryobacteraceae bacterium]